LANLATIGTKFISAWNAFRNPEERFILYDAGIVSSRPNHRTSLTSGTEQSIVLSVYNRCAIDIAMVPLRHVRVDENDNFQSTVSSGLNRCLTLSANLDQNSFNFMTDIVMSLFDEGIVAVVPVDTSVDINNSSTFDILSLRTGKIIEWAPRHIRVNLYNDNIGQKEDLVLPKDKVAIIENPLFSVMNETNSTLQRLKLKLNLLDAIDKQSGSGKLDLIMQLPFTIKSQARQEAAEKRLAALEAQLTDSKYGVGYVDATEKVIQLNRPAENNLLGQIEYLTRMLYGQLGLSEAIFTGTANEEELLNYYNRTVEPVITAIALEFKRKFLTQTAISQGQTIKHFRNPFGLVTAAAMAELVDKFSRNEVLTGNELRGVIGYVPSKDPNADQLRNKNINEKVPASPAETKDVSVEEQ